MEIRKIIRKNKISSKASQEKDKQGLKRMLKRGRIEKEKQGAKILLELFKMLKTITKQRKWTRQIILLRKSKIIRINKLRNPNNKKKAMKIQSLL